MMRRADDPEKDRSVFGSGIGQGRMIGFIVRILFFIFLGKIIGQVSFQFRNICWTYTRLSYVASFGFIG